MKRWVAMMLLIGGGLALALPVSMPPQVSGLVLCECVVLYAEANTDGTVTHPLYCPQTYEECTRAR